MAIVGNLNLESKMRVSFCKAGSAWSWEATGWPGWGILHHRHVVHVVLGRPRCHIVV